MSQSILVAGCDRRESRAFAFEDYDAYNHVVRAQTKNRRSLGPRRKNYSRVDREQKNRKWDRGD